MGKVGATDLVGASEGIGGAVSCPEVAWLCEFCAGQASEQTGENLGLRTLHCFGQLTAALHEKQITTANTNSIF